jgi:hypothetical protein
MRNKIDETNPRSYTIILNRQTFVKYLPNYKDYIFTLKN